MTPYFFKTPGWLMRWFPSMTWEKDTSSKTLYLTFDDGPVPGVTPSVLEMLEKYQARGTFFCVGDNVKKHPRVMDEVIAAGHSFGNHTFHHMNGWNTPTESYWEDVLRCEQIMNEHGVYPAFFRPPYGRIRRGQRRLVQQKYEIAMWSHLSGDFDPALDIKQSVKALKKADKGAILVFHDSFKAETNLKRLLPEVLSYFSDWGFEFKSL